MKNKAASFTDIHWGRKNNSELHNQDCIRFIQWFCDNVKADPTIDHIVFMGDWFENRSAINGLTLDYALIGAKMLDALGLPVYFIVGNHDLYYRTTREVYSTNMFDSLGFNMINTPTVIEDLGPKGALVCPFLFESEYPTLAQYLKTPVWFGHFEFKGFVITGDTKKMEHGPDPENFKNPRRIFSGHFHKRQTTGNITYIGNTFPVDFSDANDTKRGMMVYDYTLDDVTFKDWGECPTYIRTELSALIADAKSILREDAVVSCVVDTDINYEQSLKLKAQLTKKYKLREITLQESADKMRALVDTGMDREELAKLDTTAKQVVAMLGNIKAESIDNDKLIAIFEEL
jgi:DNA repair exonuclease SbcCD nuclease subunit